MSDAERVQQTGQAAKKEVAATAGQAGQAAGEVAGVAAEQAKEVAGQARQQAGTVVRDLRERVRGEARGQAERVAGTLRQWADDLGGMAENAPGDSPVRSLATQAADGGNRAADYLEKHGVDGLVGNVQDFARRRPGAFLGGAVLAGLVVGRLAKAGGKQARNTPEQATEEARPARPAAPVRDEPFLAPGPVRPELQGYPEV
ncbi:hypothetical protein [Streptomyces sp. NPDC006368]|uniref:hypothetical protein n=1 Tax=Streptomyces sp. NPDC006368 TaxID=3156760 RepID=UPI0033A93087